MNQEIITLFLAMISSFLITYLTMPSVIQLAIKKRLYDTPDDRKVHSSPIPSLGGIGIFIGVLISFTFFCSTAMFGVYKYILTAYLILFFLGIKDDLIPIRASKKLIIQICVAAILAIGGIRITHLNGIFGIEELSFIVSFIITIFFIVGVTNAFNLIDGIDGLAGGLGGINCLTLGSLLLFVGAYDYAILAFAITGSLIAFLRYNFSSYPNKTFMGDGGSLLLGLTVTILCIAFMESPKVEQTLSIVSPQVIVLGIIFIPVFDTSRIFTIRILKGKSPFTPDNNHIHHEFIKTGLTHKMTSILLYATNILLIITVLIFKNQTAINLIILLIIVGSIIIHFLVMWRFQNKSTRVNKLLNELNTINEENLFIQ